MREVRSVTIGGVGSSLSAEDLVRIAHGGRLEFEPGTLEKLQKQSEKETGSSGALSQSEDAQLTPLGDVALSEMVIRAGVCVRVATLSRSKSGIRADVLTALQQHLNAETLSLSLRGALYDSEAHSALVVASGVALSDAELAVFGSGSCFSAGVAALNLHFARALISVANSAAALSCEALAASTKAFEAQRIEAQGNKNAQDTAEALRTLLTGSRRINSREGGLGSVHGVSDVPMTHGSVLDALASLQVSLRPELNAQCLDAAALREFPYEMSWTFWTHVEAVTQSLMRVLNASVKRVRYLLEKLPSLVPLQERPDAADVSPERLTGVIEKLQPMQDELAARLKETEGRLRQLGVSEDGGPPAAGVAILGHEILKQLSRSLSTECVLNLISLHVLEGPPAATTEPAAPSGNPKKEKKRKGSGSVLGQGTAALRRFYLDQLSPSADQSENGFLGSNEELEKVVDSCSELLSMEGQKLLEVIQMIHQQIEVHQVRRKPKIPKGARDFLPDQMRIRQTVFDKITAVFKRHGAVSIDTPVFELKETLTGKYGEDSKLIYDLADQGGEILSLRYDLTVPFARYVALNSVGNIKRYHIGKVYRRDQPQMTKGRFREFFQCDFDIAGSYSVMVPDAECVKVLVEVLSDLKLGDFEVKINHRRLIDAMMDLCGVPAAKHRMICSAIDKLDKERWEVVKAEMVIEKGLDPEAAEKLGEFVRNRGTPEVLLEKLMAPEHPFMTHPDAEAALKELQTLLGCLQSMNALNNVVLDLSLARGLDYYSGLIYEAIFKDAATGSVAAGGRYDSLVGMFSGKDVPAVGVSIGVERVFAIMEKQMKESANTEGTALRTNDTQVLVGSIGSGLQQKRMEICAVLWSAGIAAEFGYKPNPKMADNLNYALQEGIPYMVLFGEDELKEGVFKIKDLTARTEWSVSNADLIGELLKRLAA